MRYGPVDVVAVAMDEPRFEGRIVAELERLASAGTIRVLDAMLLVMAEDGTRLSLDIEDLGEEDRQAMGFVETGTRGLFDAEDAEMLWEGMVPGSAVVALAIENRWAVGLIDAFEDAGAQLALHTRIPYPVVEDAMAGLEA